MAAPTTRKEVTVRRLSGAITGLWGKIKDLWKSGINSYPGAVSLGYTHLGTMTVTDANKRALFAFEVFCGREVAAPHRIEAMVGVDGISTINAAYSSECVLSSSARNRFKLCYKFAADSTAETPKIEVWLVDTGAAGTSTRRCACNVHIVKGLTWTDGNTTTETLPANLVDFVLATRQGQLTILEGGTGASTAKGAEYNILTGLGTELTTAVQDTYKIPFVLGTQSEQNGRIAGYRTASRLWDYTYGKLTTKRGLPFGNFADLNNTTTLTEIGKFTMKGPSGRVDTNIMAVFQIAYTDINVAVTSYLTVLITTVVTADTNNNITNFGDGDFIAYHRFSPTRSSYQDVLVYYKIVDGELKIYCGLSANSTNKSCRCVWTAQSGRMDFIATSVAVGTRPSNLVAATNVMDVIGTGGDESTPVYVNRAGHVKPCTNVDTMVGIIARQINGSSTTGLARLGQFVYSSGSSNIRAQATFRISATSSSKSTRCEFLVRFAFQVNVTNGKITGFSSSDIYTYKKVKTASPAIHVYYSLTEAGVINVYVGPESASSGATFRYLWSVQSVDLGVKFVVQNLGNEITTYPGNMTQVTELIEPHGTGGDESTPVYVDSSGQVEPCTNIVADSVNVGAMAPNTSYHSYCIPVVDDSGKLYKETNTTTPAPNRLYYEGRYNLLNVNISGTADYLAPAMFSDSGAPTTFSLLVFDSANRPYRNNANDGMLVYNRTAKTLAVNISGSVNGKNFVFGSYTGNAGDVCFC